MSTYNQNILLAGGGSDNSSYKGVSSRKQEYNNPFEQKFGGDTNNSSYNSILFKTQKYNNPFEQEFVQYNDHYVPIPPNNQQEISNDEITNILNIGYQQGEESGEKKGYEKGLKESIEKANISKEEAFKNGKKEGILDTIKNIFLRAFFEDKKGFVNTLPKEDGYETIITSLSSSSIFKIYTSIIIDDEYNLKYKVNIYFFMKDNSEYEKMSEITELNIHNLLIYLNEQITFYIQ